MLFSLDAYIKTKDTYQGYAAGHAHFQEGPVPNYKCFWQGINLIKMGAGLIYKGSEGNPYPACPG